MKYLYITCIMACLMSIGFSACEENKMITYQDSPAIYFHHDTYTQSDSIKQSFFICSDDAVDDTVWVIVNTMGIPSEKARPISIVQTNTGKDDAAVPGVHYKSFDDPEIKSYFSIAPGKVSQKVPIVCLRDKSLALGEYRLEMSVAENEYFRLGIDEWRNFVVTMTDMAVKPTNWDTRWRYYFGATWGSVKMKFIIQTTGYTDFENLPSDYSYLTWLGGTAKQALLEYNASHPDNPLSEADGTLVTFD